MTSDEVKPSTTIEPFDPAKHDRAAFSCGVEQVDNYFKRTANKLAKAHNISLFVMRTNADDGLIGFYALNSHSVDYRDLPEKYAKTRPGHGFIPAAYISMIGVDHRFTGQGFGGDLLIDALNRIARTTKDLGIAVVMLDVLDCGNPDLVERRLRLYKDYGFVPLPSNPLRLFIPVSSIEQLNAEELAPAN